MRIRKINGLLALPWPHLTSAPGAGEAAPAGGGERSRGACGDSRLGKSMATQEGTRTAVCAIPPPHVRSVRAHARRRGLRQPRGIGRTHALLAPPSGRTFPSTIPVGYRRLLACPSPRCPSPRTRPARRAKRWRGQGWLPVARGAAGTPCTPWRCALQGGGAGRAGRPQARAPGGRGARGGARGRGKRLA